MRSKIQASFTWPVIRLLFLCGLVCSVSLQAGCAKKPATTPPPAPVQSPAVTQTPAITTPPTATPTPTPTTPPTTTKATYHPPEIRTGNPQVDEVIDATLEAQIPTLEGLVALTPVKCRKPAAAGSGPGGAVVDCPANQPEGTPVPAFIRDTCNVGYDTDLASAKKSMGDYFKAPLGLQSVYPITRTDEAGGYAIVFVTKEKNEPRSIYVNAAGKIIGIQIGCIGAAPDSKYLLAPPQ